MMTSTQEIRRKLALRKETLRRLQGLSDLDLGAVAGGGERAQGRYTLVCKTITTQ